MNERILNLIEKLIIRTELGHLEWQKTSRENEFKVDMESGAVSTDSWNSDEIDLVDFRVFNNIGDEIGSWVFESNADQYKILINLHSTVKRKYLRIDETINGMLSELA